MPSELPSPRHRFHHIEQQGQAALEVARKLVADLSGRGPQFGPPYDPANYARELDIPVAPSTEMRDWDALLIPTSAGFRILYNASVRSEGRRRFSIAHEIAHTFFPDANLAVQRRSKREDYHTPEEVELERWCDRIAAELLMPEATYRSYRDEQDGNAPSAESIPALAEAFGVSRQAAAVRYVELAETPCAVAFFEWSHRPSVEQLPPAIRNQVSEGRKYRVQTSFRSPEFPRLFGPGTSVAQSSVVYRSSLGRTCLSARESFRVNSSTRRTLDVSAYPLHGAAGMTGPPTVCALFVSAHE